MSLGHALQFSLFSEIGVLETEEVEYAVQSDGVDGLLGIGHDSGLGVEGDAQTCFGNHGKVVGTVADGDGLGDVYFLHSCNELQ